MRISNYFIKQKIENLARKENRVKTFRSMNEIGRVIIFCNSSEQKEVLPCVSRLAEMGKKVLICSYGTMPEAKTGEGVSLLEIIPKKDLDLRGIPSASIVKKLNDFAPDISIDLTTRVSYPLQYLFLCLVCDFKVGITKKDHKQYDFSISVTENTDLGYLFGQIIFYLQTIRTK